MPRIYRLCVRTYAQNPIGPRGMLGPHLVPTDRVMCSTSTTTMYSLSLEEVSSVHPTYLHTKYVHTFAISFLIEYSLIRGYVADRDHLPLWGNPEGCDPPIFNAIVRLVY